MKIAFLLILGCVLALRALAQLETNLTQEIKNWRKGDAPPARLLKFPDGKIDPLPECGLWEISAGVGHYIAAIQDADLLAALMFDPRADVATLRAATSRMIELKGIGYVSRLFAERLKTEPQFFRHSEQAILSQLVHVPYVTVQVARIAYGDVPAEKADTALATMRDDLRVGATWAEAYRKQADSHPDMVHGAKDPKSPRTLISYLYDCVVSPTGFDIANFQMAENIPLQHLPELFRLKQGTHVLKTADGVYLYHIRDHYQPE